MNNHTADQWATIAAALLPPGIFWQGFRARDGAGRALLKSKGKTHATLETTATRLLKEVFPSTTASMLTDWEAVLGLPDRCTPDKISTAERLQAVVARLSMLGGATPSYFSGLAAQYGYTVGIRQYKPARCGVAVCGHSELIPLRWHNHWRVLVSGQRLTRARCAVSRCGDSLGVFRAAKDLECLLRRVKPAGTYLHFDYFEG